MLTKKELLKYTGNMSQISGVSEFELTAGKARGMRVWQFRCGNGLEFSLLPDKCLDLYSATYRGMNINWQSKAGFSGTAAMQPVPGEFDRYFGGGMLWSCGLKNTGGDYVDENGMFQLLHGRLGILPCEQAWHKCGFVGDDYVLEAGGTVRESGLGAYNLTLTRHIKASLSSAQIEITDTLENHEPQKTDYLILYHYNFGYPFLCPDIRLKFPQAQSPVEPRSEAAKRGIGQWDKFGDPVDLDEEQCFFHDLKPGADGFCEVSLENPGLGFGVKLAYDKSTLPILTQWKSLRSGEYVMGIEPGNSYLRGMATERQEGTVGTIEAFGSKVFKTKLKFYDLNK